MDDIGDMVVKCSTIASHTDTRLSSFQKSYTRVFWDFHMQCLWITKIIGKRFLTNDKGLVC